MNISQFQAATHISRANCAKITGDKPRQPAYEIVSVKHRNSLSIDSLSPLGSRHQIWVFHSISTRVIIARCTLIPEVAAPMLSSVSRARAQISCYHTNTDLFSQCWCHLTSFWWVWQCLLNFWDCLAQHWTKRVLRYCICAWWGQEFWKHAVN